MKLTKTQYNTLHQWLGRNFIKTGVCEFCRIPKTTEWSNKTGNYTRDRREWQELCRKCHLAYDYDIIKQGSNKGIQKRWSSYYKSKSENGKWGEVKICTSCGAEKYHTQSSLKKVSSNYRCWDCYTN